VEHCVEIKRAKTKTHDPVDVGTIEHVGAMATGALLFAVGMTRKGMPAALARSGGIALFLRGARGYAPIYRAMGIGMPATTTGTSKTAIRVESAVEINRPASDLYYLWRDFENLPAFMSHLISVKQIDEERSHWVARGPAGTVVQWDAKVVNDVPDKVIAWETYEGSSVDHAGSIHFDSTENGKTRLRVVFRYDPPAGTVGAFLARMFHGDPQREIDEDLRRFQKMIDGLTRAQEKVKIL
jgi:uncharacterized membrane protein